MISQSSSEASICFVGPEGESGHAVAALEEVAEGHPVGRKGADQVSVGACHRDEFSGERARHPGHHRPGDT